MALSNNDQAKVRDYLLGRLTDEEQEKIEERLMTEDELFEELEISKGELIEEYGADELPQHEREWFKNNYLASAEGRQRRVFALALDSIKRSTPAPQRLTWFEGFKALLKTRPWTVAIATSAVLVAIIVGAIIYRGPASTPPASYAFSLNSTISRRSTGEARFHKVPFSPGTGELIITLQLPEGVARGNTYRIELDDRRQITRLNETSHDANAVVVVIPSASMREGMYSLRLYAIRADGTEQAVPGEYLFELVNSTGSTATDKPKQNTNQQ